MTGGRVRSTLLVVAPLAGFLLAWESAVALLEVPHFILTHAVNLTSVNGGGRFTFGADCRPCEELVEAARDIHSAPSLTCWRRPASRAR